MRILLLMAVVFLAAPPATAANAALNAAPQRREAPPPEARIDINRASADELMKATGISRVWAERIVRFRPYRSKQALVDQGVISASLYDRIKDFVIAHRK
jgi:DNA uptake protein ComE-like DNA-binding protein